APLERFARDAKIDCGIGWMPLTQTDVPVTVPLSKLLSGDAHFPNVAVSELSTLCVFTIRLRAPALNRQYVLLLDNPDFPRQWRERRDRAVVEQEIRGHSVG